MSYNSSQRQGANNSGACGSAYLVIVGRATCLFACRPPGRTRLLAPSTSSTSSAACSAGVCNVRCQATGWWFHEIEYVYQDPIPDKIVVGRCVTPTKSVRRPAHQSQGPCRKVVLCATARIAFCSTREAKISIPDHSLCDLW